MKKTSRTLAENPGFVRLVRIAQQDPATHGRLLSLLDLPPDQRAPAFHTFAAEFKLRAPDLDIAEAFDSIADNAVAARVRTMLAEAPAEASTLSRSLPSELLLIPKILLGMGAGLLLPILILSLLQAVAWRLYMPGTDSSAVSAAISLSSIVGAVIGAVCARRTRWLGILALSAIAALLGGTAQILSPLLGARPVEFDGTVISAEPFVPDSTDPNAGDGVIVSYAVDTVHTGPRGMEQATVCHLAPPGQLTVSSFPVQQRFAVRGVENRHRHIRATRADALARNAVAPEQRDRVVTSP